MVAQLSLAERTKKGGAYDKINDVSLLLPKGALG